MFEKYNLKDLYIGTVNVIFAESNFPETNIGGILQVGTTGYSYWTILRKTDEGKFIDLQAPERNISTVRDLRVKSFIVGYTEPLSKYYGQNGEKRKTFSLRKALVAAETHYDEFQANELKYIKQQ